MDWLHENYHKILDGSILAIPQNTIGLKPTYCTRRYPFDGEIDWKKPAAEIYNFIRAQSTPYPGAFTYYGGEKMTIWAAELIDVIYYGIPGRVATIDDKGVWIICGDNKPLILGAVQVTEREKCLASKIIKSRTIGLGRK